MTEISFEALRGFSPLFRAYTSDFERVADFYAHDPFDVHALREAARRAARHPRDRATVARVLSAQNERWGADDAVRRNIERLARPDTVAIVTGQQLGLFTGPIYTLYKTLTAIQLAARLTAEGIPAVPVFWLHGEDHDFDEIAAVTVLDGDVPVTLRYDHPVPPEGNVGPVGRLVLTDDITRVLDGLEAALPDTTDRARLMSALRESYAPGTAMVDAFARFARTLFPDTGLVFLNPDDADLKRLLVPLFQHDVQAGSAVAEAVAVKDEQLVEAGFHVQVRVSPTNLFVMDEGGRLAVDEEEGHYRVRGTDEVLSQPELLADIAARPERFSPNVLLRPLSQDTLLPTAAYVAGPGEIAYFGQFQPAYEKAGLPMPVLFPRVSVTLVERRIEQLMARHHLALSDLDGRPDMVFQHLVADRMDGHVREALAGFEAALGAAVDAIEPTLAGLDVNLKQSAEATRVRLAKEYDRLRVRALRAEKRRQADLQHAVARVQAHLFPEEKPQERVLSACYFMATHGDELSRWLLQRLSLDTRAHYLISVSGFRSPA